MVRNAKFPPSFLSPFLFTGYMWFRSRQCSLRLRMKIKLSAQSITRKTRNETRCISCPSLSPHTPSHDMPVPLSWLGCPLPSYQKGPGNWDGVTLSPRDLWSETRLPPPFPSPALPPGRNLEPETGVPSIFYPLPPLPEGTWDQRL